MRFLARFPRERLLVVLYDDFALATGATLRTVLRFLEVDERVPIDTAIRHNPTGVPRNPVIERLTAKTPLALALKRHLPPAVRDPLYRLAMQLRGANRARPSLPPPLHRRLLDIFREDTLALSHYLERDLSAWLEPKAPWRQAPPLA